VSKGVTEAPLLLVVDDEPTNVDVLRDLLEALGYRTLGATGGEAALALVREGTADLVLLDVMMPEMDGLEVCRRLKSDPATAGIPVVFVTALSDDSARVRAIEAGGDDFLTKPFSRPVLVARIRALLALKGARDELAESYRRLRELEALRDDLTRMVVHDLKAPLAGMLASLEVVLDGDAGPLTLEQRTLLGGADELGGDLLRMTENLLDLSAGVRLHPRDIELRPLLSQVAGAWALRAERAGAKIETVPGEGLTVRADEQMVRRVLGNLVGNALRHAGAGVTIRLGAARAEEPGAVEVSVADDGAGIDHPDPDRLFERTPRSGLGLPFCRIAVEAHGGRIWLRSRPSGGTAFHFVLPEAGAPAAALPA
jgi:two-component system, sensor histidine kinase and response regulator